VGDFTGAYLGMYASAHGQSSANAADFDWFEYSGRDQDLA
jgi:alpha-N-arabinofuranosidase